MINDLGFDLNFIVGKWYWYEEYRFRIESVEKDQTLIYCPEDESLTSMNNNSWMAVGCIEEEEYLKMNIENKDL